MALDLKDPETQKAIKEAAELVANSLKADADAKAEVANAEQAKINAAVKAELEKRDKETAAGQRLPGGDQAPYAAKFADTWKYDNLDPGDNALFVEVLEAGRKT